MRSCKLLTTAVGSKMKEVNVISKEGSTVENRIVKGGGGKITVQYIQEGGL